MGRVLSSRWLLLASLALSGCPQGGGADAGPGPDSGAPPPSCDSPEDCRGAGYDGVCRATECRADVPCGDDVECGLGERCVAGLCRFTGCTEDADCASGRCRTESFACAECGQASDCPADRPVCNLASNACVQCTSDLQCSAPGPVRCDAARGVCTWCLEDRHCPNGLTCGAGGVCKGAGKGAGCDLGVTCDVGLACIAINGVSKCLETCSLYRVADCPSGESCYKLTYADSPSLVFESTEPIGVCYAEQANLRGVNELCTKTGQSSTCQPNLECVPESAVASRCRRFCDPVSSAGCIAPDQCHPFIGDGVSHRYGLCYPDNGYGQSCTGEAGCRSALACMPFDDPSQGARLSPVCQFAVGAQPALGPCAPQPLPDGGALSADRACRSGACVTDSPGVGPNYCFGACAADVDCAVGGRQGYCDRRYTFAAVGGTGSLRGCRPSCADEAACAEYDGGYTCRVGLDAGASPMLEEVCGSPAGLLRAGEPCTAGAQCRSGFCHLVDSRGVARFGACAEACNAQGDCEAAVVDGGLPDGGRAAPVACSRAALLGYRGLDDVAGTADDKLVSASLCTGAPCASDEACGDPDGGAQSARCVPEYAPATPGAGLELRCRGANAGGALEAPAACTADSECLSGVCGTLQAPSTGTGRTCFRACDGASACPAGTVCRDGALRVGLAFGGFQALRSCAP